jgi:hypothetical protein
MNVYDEQSGIWVSDKYFISKVTTFGPNYWSFCRHTLILCFLQLVIGFTIPFQLLPLSYLIRIFFIAGPTYQQGLAILGYKARNIYKGRLLVGVYVVVRLSYSESRCVLVGFFSMYCDSDSNNIHDLFLHVMHYSVISVCVCVCVLSCSSSKLYSLVEKKD